MRQCLETTARLPTFTPTPTLQKGTKIISHLKSQIPRYTPNHPTPTQKKRIKNKSSLNPKDIPKIPNIPTKIPLKKISFPPPQGSHPTPIIRQGARSTRAPPASTCHPGGTTAAGGSPRSPASAPPGQRRRDGGAGGRPGPGHPAAKRPGRRSL